jgi:hypothetical protein
LLLLVAVVVDNLAVVVVEQVDTALLPELLAVGLLPRTR